MWKIIDMINEMNKTPLDGFTFVQTLFFTMMVIGSVIFSIASLIFICLAITRSPWFIAALPLSLSGGIVCISVTAYTAD